MLYEHRNYRLFLKEILVQRRRSNSRYSLRAMATQAGFSHSTLSEVMNGAANLSSVSARKLAAHLKLNANETEYFCLLVQLDRADQGEMKASILAQMNAISPKRLSKFDLNVDQFRQISDWYHSAILEMVHLNRFKITPRSVSRRLGISELEAELAIERLLRLGLLAKDASGKVTEKHERVLTECSAQTNEAFRNFFKQMLVKAGNALKTQGPECRVSGYETMAIAKAALPEAREIIEKFFSEMIALGQRHPVKRDVYHLIVHFFNLTDQED